MSAVAPEGARTFERVGVLGFGTMGMGIVYAAAAAGCSVTVLETDESRIEAGFVALDRFLARGVAIGKSSEADAAELRGRITGVTDPSAFADTELVIEAVFEDFEAKRAVLGRVTAFLGGEALVATNTS
ncbi:MAG TPA: 3-hydroxyacyl-CoA dehydrogenase NAD-binding domain-containing protein, partial [Acidimicrobiales bacterium]|nr:3-hydroxyacyl-CoA dehydrogenase NAD-binding domain-containing protein [Acidimicrobiales bacterium]